MHYVLAVVISLLVGVALGYAFRGKEHAALSAAGSAAQKGAGSIQSAVGNVAKKL